ncbi:MAG: SPOR domain-containing protein [Armatimonadota bacterium]|nr:SPOR domain-containing protein [Armatimonadota bacterium]MCX7777426.1 SPOR domain-containing protein [Armatimonadota bacterium]MDW8025095.1 SPOR domain-containing protein [Armatimonadota bacterium]
MRKSRRQRFRSLFEFLAGIAIVVGAIGFYQLGKGVIGPYLRTRVSSVTNTVATGTAGLGSEAISQSFVRSDMALIPDETTVTIEPIQAPSEETIQPQSTAPSEGQETPPEAISGVSSGEETQSSEGEVAKPVPDATVALPPSRTTIEIAPPQRIPQPERPKRQEMPSPQPRRQDVKPIGEQPPSETNPSEVLAGGIRRRYQVQAGLFRLKENADRLVQELVSKGYQPSVEVVKAQGGELYRVVVGAFDDRNDAERLVQELDELGIKAIVREVEKR